MERGAAWMVRHRLGLFVTFILLTLAALPFSFDLRYARTIDSFFDPDHPLLLEYHAAEKEFGGDSVCVAVYEDHDLLTLAGLKRLRALTDKLAAVPGVGSVKSLADLRRPSMAIDPRDLIAWLDSNKVTPKALADEVMGTYLYNDQFVGSDRKTAACLVLLTDEIMQGGGLGETINGLRAVLGEAPYRGQIVGAPILLNDFFDKIEEDAWTLTTVSVGTMALVIWILFRNVRWVVLPLAIVFSSLIWMRAGVNLVGLDPGFTAAMTTALISVIGIATTIHIAVCFREENDETFWPPIALERALERVLPAVFWTCVTTAIGFGSMILSQVQEDD